MNDSEKKLDIIISSLSRIEEKVANHKEDILKLEKTVESLNSDMNKGKGAIAFLGILSALLALKSFILKA